MSQEGSNCIELGISQIQVRSVTAETTFQLSLYLVHTQTQQTAKHVTLRKMYLNMSNYTT